jgi:hypothetical protein
MTNSGGNTFPVMSAGAAVSADDYGRVISTSAAPQASTTSS